MIDAVILENFRCWHGRHEIELRPLTLICGANSSGKSSLFHALLLLRQTLEAARGRQVPLRPVGPSVTLGDFGTLISGHDRALPLRIGIRYQGARKHPALDPLGQDRRVELEFVAQGELPGGAVLRRILLQLGDRQITFVEGPEGFELEKKLTGPRESVEADAAAAVESAEVGADAAAELRELLFHALGEKAFQTPELAQALGILDERTRFEFSQGLPARARPLMLADTDEEMGLGALQALLQLHDAWAGLCAVIGEELAEVLDRLRYLGPLREVPGQVQYSEAGADRPADVGVRGEHLAQVLVEPGVRREFNQALQAMDVRYEVEVDALTDSQGAHSSARRLLLHHLVEEDGPDKGIDVDGARPLRRDGLSVGMRDVGFGISQSFPVILQVLLASKRTLSVLVEEPELHLNPKHTAQLAQLAADVIRMHPQSQIIYETHSAEIVLRIANCVSAGEILPGSARIVFVQQLQSTAQAIAVDYMDDGMLSPPGWPERDGFFPQREWEIRELCSGALPAMRTSHE